jgi:c-di-GMP-binding flagellar brake protein YcgR
METLQGEVKEKLDAPLSHFTEDEVKARLSEVFPDRWEREFTFLRYSELCCEERFEKESSIDIGSRFCLAGCRITADSDEQQKAGQAVSYVLAIEDGDWTEERIKRLAFLNTAVRVLGVGLNRRRPNHVTFGSGEGADFEQYPMDMGDVIFDAASAHMQITRPPFDDFTEKRKTPRKLLPLHKAITMDVKADGIDEELSIFLLDISRTGMRIISSFELPVGINVKLRLEVQEDIDLEATVLWQKGLWEGMFFVGFQFEQMVNVEFEKICRFLQGFSPDDRREHFRLDLDLLAELISIKDGDRIRCLIQDLSLSGMKVVHKGTRFDWKQRFHCKIYRGFEDDFMEVEAETVWSKELLGGMSVSAFRFIGMNEEKEKAVQEIIENCIITDLREALGEISHG